MTSRRILSLDFDGVLHPAPESTQFVTASHFAWLPILQRMLISHSQIEILVHSTWRHRYDLQELRLLLGDALGPRVVAAAPAGDDRCSNCIRSAIPVSLTFE